uniref:PROP1-like PPR domain-containing protein n=1 Tax=Kalanchoe fedtschenkoi TaxID=63787 RepID=A0A7N0TL13_KALFE
MPPKPDPAKFTIFHGHRRPSQNRPIVRGGFFSNRQTLTNPKSQNPKNHPHFNFAKWDPDATPPQSPPTTSPSHRFFTAAKTLSPIARYICDSFRKHQRWGPDVMSDLNKLRRVTPNLVAEVLKVQTDARLSSKFFHWAGKQKGFRHDFASYNAFAYCLNRSNQFRGADQVPELMQLQAKPPSEKQFEILIRMHADANRGLRVYYVYQKMRKFGIKPRIFLYNRVMEALVKTGHLDLALSVYEDLKEDGLVEESITYLILVKGMCKEGRMDEMMELLNRMRGRLCKPDVFAYTAMVKILVSVGDLDGCLRVWEEMKRDRVEPDVMAYGTLISGLCKGSRAEEGYMLFKEMKSNGCLIDRSIYRSLIEAFVAHGKVGKACDLLKDLMDSGYRADLSIYNALIEGMCSVEQVDKAYRLFQVTVAEGLEPHFSTVRPMLVSYAELNRLDDFLKMLVHMEKLKFQVTDDLSKLFSYMVESEKIALAADLFDVLKLKGYCNVPIYNILMGAFRKMGDVKKALSLFNEVKDSNFDPDASTYSISIECFVEEDEIHKACESYNKIVKASHVPSISAYSSLARGLCRAQEIDAAIMLVRDCLASVTDGPMDFKYTLTILHVCKSGSAEKVLEVIDEMLEQGCEPNELIYSAIISGMCKHGNLEEARKVFSSIRACDLLSEANAIAYDEILIEHMKKKTADLVLCGLKFFGLERKLKKKGSTLLSAP